MGADAADKTFLDPETDAAVKAARIELMTQSREMGSGDCYYDPDIDVIDGRVDLPQLVTAILEAAAAAREQSGTEKLNRTAARVESQPGQER